MKVKKKMVGSAERVKNEKRKVKSEIFELDNYTMRQHLDELGLINMNGRAYDPLNGRFLNPDKVLQDPYGSQSYNPYSYCLNNPLKYTDPSEWVSRNWDNQRWSQLMDNLSASINSEEGQYLAGFRKSGGWIKVDVWALLNTFFIKYWGKSTGTNGDGGLTPGPDDKKNASKPDDKNKKKSALSPDTYYFGVPVYYQTFNGTGCYLPGVGIFVEKNDPAWLQHEFGHYLTYKLLGEGFYLYVIFQSGGDMLLNWSGFSTNEEHNDLFVEKLANSLTNFWLNRLNQISYMGLTSEYPLLNSSDFDSPFRKYLNSLIINNGYHIRTGIYDSYLNGY